MHAMQSLKQNLWLLFLIAGAVAGWFVMPHHGRNLPGLLLVCAVMIAIVVFSERRRAAEADKYSNRYFVRCLRYDLMGGQILITDNKSPRVITLDTSLHLIFGAADGQRTGQQYVHEIEADFPGIPLPGFSRETYRLMAKMEAKGLIRFSDQPVQLPYYLSMPSSVQDQQRALEEMRKDGFIK